LTLLVVLKGDPLLSEKIMMMLMMMIDDGGKYDVCGVSVKCEPPLG
jgi:hypothetical protein